MSVILQPQSSFPIVRQIANHLDTDVLYVRAVVRNADGDAIETVDLEDKGGQRFQRRYRVPVDSSGQGAYISIITSVYTDAGYTTKSPNYGDEENTYLVFDRVTAAMRGGGGVSVDMTTFRRIVAEELNKVKPEPIEIEEAEVEKPDLVTPKLVKLADEIESLQVAVGKIPTEPISLEPVIANLSEIKQMITDKDVTPETNLTPIYEELDTLSKEVTDELISHRLFLNEVKTDMIDSIAASVQKAVDDVEFVTDVQLKPQKKQPTEVIPKEKEIPPVDLRKLV